MAQAPFRSNRLFDTGAPTARERAGLRRVNTAAQPALFDVAAETPPPCHACAAPVSGCTCGAEPLSLPIDHDDQTRADYAYQRAAGVVEHYCGYAERGLVDLLADLAEYAHRHALAPMSTVAVYAEQRAAWRRENPR